MLVAEVLIGCAFGLTGLPATWAALVVLMFSSWVGCADDEISCSPFQADLWAAGVTLFAVSSGRLPFWDARGGQPLFDAIISQKVQYPETMSLELRALLDQMLNRSTTRPGISALRQHPWVVDGEGGSRHGNGQNEKKTNEKKTK